jgi:hypothetical protein
MEFKVKENLDNQEVVRTIENLIELVETESRGGSVHVIENFSVDKLRKLIYETTPAFEFKGEFNMPDPKKQIKVLLDNMEQDDLIVTFDASRNSFSTTFYKDGHKFGGWPTPLTMFLCEALHKHLGLEFKNEYIKRILEHLNGYEEMRRKFAESGDEGFIQYVNEKLSDPTNRWVTGVMVDNKLNDFKFKLQEEARQKLIEENKKNNLDEDSHSWRIFDDPDYRDGIAQYRKNLANKVVEIFGKENVIEVKDFKSDGYVKFQFKSKYDLLKALDKIK